MTSIAIATAAPALTRAALSPTRPHPLRRAEQRWQRRLDREHAGAVAAAAPPAGAPPAPPRPSKKGKRPTHELTRVILVDGHKAYQPVGVMWLRENGGGFMKLNADLKAGDNLMLAPLKSGGASRRASASNGSA